MTDCKRCKDEFTRGYLVAIGSLVGGFGNSTEAEHLFLEIGAPSATEVRRLGLCEYDRKQLAEVRKYAK